MQYYVTICHQHHFKLKIDIPLITIKLNLVFILQLHLTINFVIITYFV